MNIGVKFKNERHKHFKTFAFSYSGSEQHKDMQQGIGIGLSTADSLANSLGGRVFVSSTQFLGEVYRTEVMFKIKVTNFRFKNAYQEDLKLIRKNKES